MSVIKREGLEVATGESKLEVYAASAHEKCEGIRCAYKESCNRYLTRNEGINEFYSFYALADTDCEYHQPMIKSEVTNG